jgi:electron transport complex protein RnfE
MKTLLAYLKKGIIDENPVFVQVLGMCATLAVTTSVTNGLGMGLATTAVLICSNVVISLIRKLIPNKIRIAAYIVVIAGFVTVVDMLLKAYAESLSASLGIFIPLIVVNCIILARAEAFASKNPVGASALDGISMGLGFTVALVLMSAVRELLGNGTLLDIRIIPEGINIPVFILPAGGFFTLGCLIAAVNAWKNRKAKKETIENE